MRQHDENARRSGSHPDAGTSGFALLATLTLLFLATPLAVHAQLQSDARAGSRVLPRVFLDCQDRPNCNSDHFRTEIQFVNWVRDRADSDVHVIFTSTGLSDGGRQYAIDFVGRRDLEGLNDEFTYTSSGTDVQSEVMDGLTQTLGFGLIRYAVETGAARHLVLAWEGPEGNGTDNAADAENGEEEFYDPWNYWTFRFGLSGNMDLSENRTNARLNPSMGADRVTAGWKINTSFWMDMRRDRRTLSDGREFRNDRNNWRSSVLVVRSVTPHMSVGIDASARNSIQNNQRTRVSMAPAVEYNYYPYEQANRRQFIAHWAAGVEYSDYYEETTFGTTRETLPQHRMGVQYRAREQWGNAGVGIDTSQYLHDLGLYSFGFSGDLSYRVTRGLELNISGGASFVNDNIHTPAEAIDDEDIISGRQAMPSSYEYQASVGFNYRWGSSFANIVNNRFPRSVRE
jgi:hypothetical protein